MFALNRRRLYPILFAVCALLVAGWTYGRVTYSSAPTGMVIYVDHAAMGNSDGSTWEHAYPSLQSALTAATSGDEIWVAQGVYKPTETNIRELSFILNNEVAIYGGFAATETLRTERDWEANITVLSGDIDNNDLTDPNGVVTNTTNIVGNNSYHVVIGNGANSSTLLDGFTITAGQATSGSYPDSYGGGMYNYMGVPTLNNIIFSGNYASGQGGGLFILWGGTRTFTNIHFVGNGTALYSGGGMYNWESNITLVKASFSQNHALNGGGGGLSSNRNSVTLVDVVFNENRAEWGGGLFNGFASNTSLNQVRFSGNFASQGGGGLANWESNLTMTNVLFSGNMAQNQGGAVFNNGGSPTLTNVTLSGNQALQAGGGIYNMDNFGIPTPIAMPYEVFNDSPLNSNMAEVHTITTTPTPLSPSTATLNHHSLPNPSEQITNQQDLTPPRETIVASAGSITDILLYEPSYYRMNMMMTANIVLQNVVLWNNQDSSGIGSAGSSITNTAGNNPIVRHSLVQGCNPEGVWLSACGINDGGNLADTNPLFIEPVDPINAPSVDGNLRLQLTSPAIDRGQNTYLPPQVTADLDGNPRVMGAAVDLGAYETYSCLIYVNSAATGANNGTTWADAFTDLQTPLNLVTGTCEIWVAQGIYKPTSTADRTISFAMKSGVAIYGGFAATETLRTERDWEANITVLSGDIDNNDITDPNGVVTDTANIVGNNSYHVVVSNGTDDTAILDGFTITAGLANGSYAPLCGPHIGGGLCNYSSHLNLTNLVFSGNQASSGGGLYSTGGNLTLTYITFNHNQASNSGGGMQLYGTAILQNVHFANNQAIRGGGMAISDSSNPVLIRNASFNNNEASAAGGIYISLGNVILENARFINNKASNQGGGLYFAGGTYNNNYVLSLTNSIFIGNEGYYGGGGVFNMGGILELTNVSFSGNAATNGDGGGMHQDSYVPTPTPTALVSLSPDDSEVSYLPTPTPQVNSESIQEQESYLSNANPVRPLTLQNVVTWNNRDASGTGTASSSIVNSGYGTLSIIRFSLIQGCNPAGAWVASCGTDDGGNLADADPLFVEPPDPANAPTTAGNLRLLPNSPAIDAGNNSYLPPAVTTDLDGNPRLIGTAVDLGAYESNSYLIHPNLIGQGAITLLPDTPTYTWGTAITATAAPHPGWSFAHWSGDLSGTANPITFTVQGHTTLTATFANDPPTAEAGPNQTVLTNTSVTLDGSGSADGDPAQTLSYGWVQTGGSPVALSESTAVSPTFTAPASRTVLTFTLTVTDSLGTPSTADEVVVTVQETGLAIHFHATPTTAEVGQTITYTLVITNHGDVLLSGLSVTDTLTADFDPPPTLAPSGSVSLVTTYTVLADDLPGPLTNQVWVAAMAEGEPLTAEATAVVSLLAAPPAVRYTIYLPLVKK